MKPLPTPRTDLAPLFNWNTKQVFVYMMTDYASTQYVRPFYCAGLDRLEC